MKRWIYVASATLAGALLAPAHRAEAASAAPSAAFAPQAAPADLPPNDSAKALIDGDPRVGQARHALEAARRLRGALRRPVGDSIGSVPLQSG